MKEQVPQMFKKVLIAEDIDSINYAVSALLKKLEIEEVVHANYCDKAKLLAKKSMQEDMPFDLLICDLSFKADHRTEKIRAGREFIDALKKENPNIKVLVNTTEDHPQTVKNLWNTGYVDGYVCNDRHGITDLEEAIIALNKGGKYASKRIGKILGNDNILVLGDWEMELLNAIATGLTYDDISEDFKKKPISPNSKSIIEKRLKELREEFGAKTTPHLIGILKDLRLL